MKTTLSTLIFLMNFFVFGQTIGPNLYWGEWGNEISTQLKATALNEDVAIINVLNESVDDIDLMMLKYDIHYFEAIAFSYSSDNQQMIMTDLMVLNDTILAVSGLKQTNGNNFEVFVLLLNDVGLVYNCYSFNTNVSAHDVRVEKVTDSTFLLGYSNESGEQTILLMNKNGTVDWADRTTISNFDYLADIKFGGNNRIFVLQSISGATRIVEMDLFGNKLQGRVLSNSSQPAQVEIFQDSIFVLRGDEENVLELIGLSSNGLSINKKYQIQSSLRFSSDGIIRHDRMVNYLDSSLLVTTSEGYTLEMDKSLNVINTYLNFDCGGGIIVHNDNSVSYLLTGPFSGVKASSSEYSQFSYVKQDTLFDSQDYQGCFYENKSYGLDTNTNSMGTVLSSNLINLNPSSINVIRINKTLYQGNSCVQMTGGIKEENIYSEIEAYPNPAQNTLEIASEYQIDKVEIINALGKVESVNIIDARFVDVTQLSSGVYFIRVKLENGTWATQRFIKGEY